MNTNDNLTLHSSRKLKKKGSHTRNFFIDFDHIWQKGNNLGYLWSPSVIHGWSVSSRNDRSYSRCYEMIEQNIDETQCIQKIINKDDTWSKVQFLIISFFEKYNLILNKNYFQLTRSFQELIDYKIEILEIEQLLQECKYIYDNQ